MHIKKRKYAIFSSLMEDHIKTKWKSKHRHEILIQM